MKLPKINDILNKNIDFSLERMYNKSYTYTEVYCSFWNEVVKEMKIGKTRRHLVLYDIGILLMVDFLMLVLYKGREQLPWDSILVHWAISMVCIFPLRFLGNIYHQIWRYGGIQCYIRLLLVDACAFVLTLMAELTLPLLGSIQRVAFPRLLSIACMNLLGALAIRMVYRYAFKCGQSDTNQGKLLRLLLRVFAGEELRVDTPETEKKIKIAIVGAGRVGVNLAEELLANRAAAYIPQCFIDVNLEKAGREIHGIPVLLEDETSMERLHWYKVQEVVFAIPNLSEEKRRQLYESYAQAGYKIKVYDYPVMQTAGKKRYMREFDIEELLFRKPVIISDEKIAAYYRDKVILITGGGGSIGSELCRQLAKMRPRKIVILDIYENGAYDVQQELKIAYAGDIDLEIEICSITNEKALQRVFAQHRPQIVINAAAHKHVPLMERNCIEAVHNNVFGTWNLVQMCERFGTQRFMMVSTDKAVNPTNVMGATKRMCEMIVGSASTWGNTKYSATRFGNVLGSAGSVIPLFKRQIANGGPITLTDKRIVRYFMTIPEASQLVLQSGAMARNGELFVLDMGQPVQILELAQSMIRLSGMNDIEIVETGLRPGEKLYEELLVNRETMEKTENSLIFIEKDTQLSRREIEEKLRLLKDACHTDDDSLVRQALHRAVPTYKTPEEVNAEADGAAEMAECREPVGV